MAEYPKQINFNTFLLFAVGVMVAVIGFFAKHQLETVEQTIKDTHALIMPRQEIEAQLTARKEDIIRIDAQLIYVRSKVDVMELELARLKKP